MTGSGPDIDALVVGGGPVGLAFSSECARYGLRSRLVEKVVKRSPHSRAFGLHARTLEFFFFMGVLPAILNKSYSTSSFAFVLGRNREITVDLKALKGTSFPQLTLLSQAETEASLEAHLNDLGGHVERGVELLSFEQTTGTGGSFVSARLRHPDGKEETIRTKYLVGTDGAHSITRKLLGLPFTGTQYAETFYLGDFLMQPGSFLPPGAKLNMWGEQLLVTIGIRQDLLRVIFAKPPSADPPADAAVSEAPTAQDFQSVVSQYYPNMTLGEPLWLNAFRIHRRGVQRYREGNVFLAGDAAHIHSPAGGQGLNTGLGDAVNLAWKMALVERKGADPAILDSYNAERHPVGADVLSSTDTFTRVLFSRNLLLRLFRTLVLPLLLSIPQVRYAMARQLAQLQFTYRASPIVREVGWLWGGIHSGDRVPDSVMVRAATGEEATMLEVLNNGLKHTLLLVGGTEEGLPAGSELERLVKQCGDVMKAAVVVGVEAGAPLPRGVAGAAAEVLLDPDNAVSRGMGLPSKRQSLLLVRPDGHVALRTSGWDVVGLREYLKVIFPRRGL